MKKLLIGAAAMGILAVGSTALAGSADVGITNAGFKPASVTVQSGDSVSWTNSDAVRHEVDVNGTSCKLSLEPSQSSSCTFPTAGTFSYADPTASGSGFSGTVGVAQNSRSVTLNSSRLINIFGDAVTLSGTVSSKNAGDHVTVVAQPVGLPQTQTDVTTTSGGNWTLHVQPRVKTTYKAIYDTATSAPLTVTIRPRITLEKVGRHQYLIVVLAARSMAGRHVNVTRWTPGRGWVTFQQATLQSIARTPTTSDAYVTTFVRLGTKLRIFMPAAEVGADYSEGHSNFIVN
jgi:plastocyanin